MFAPLMSFMSALELLLKFFILAIPFIFLNWYCVTVPFSFRLRFIKDALVVLPIPVIFLAFFLTEFSFNPLTTSESRLTELFISWRQSGLNPEVVDLYYNLGKLTSLAPACSLFAIYGFFKSYLSACCGRTGYSFLYFLMAIICVYAVLWCQQRIGILLILSVILVLFLAQYIRQTMLNLLVVSLPLGVTLLLILLPIDIRHELWWESSTALDLRTFLVGGGIDVFGTYGFSYFHPHNVYLLFLFEFGIFSAISFVALSFAYCRMLDLFGSQLAIHPSKSLTLAKALFCCFLICLAANSDLLSREYWVAVLGFVLPIKLYVDYHDV